MTLIDPGLDMDTKYIISLRITMVICIKQHLRNIEAQFIKSKFFIS